MLQAFPDQADALHLLGALQYQRGELDEAIENIQRAIAVAPAEPSFRLTLGTVYQTAKRLADAIRTYEELIARHPHVAAAHDHLGVALSIEGRAEDAAREFRLALKLDASNPATMANLGIALCRLGEYEEAIVDLRRAVALSPSNYVFRASLANALACHGNYEDAVTCCREAIALSSDRGEAYVTLNVSLTALNRFEEAVEPGRRAVERLPALPDARVGLSVSLLQAGRLDEARRCVNRACHFFLMHLVSMMPSGFSYAMPARWIALAEFRRAMDLRLEAGFHSHLLYAMQFHPSMDASTIFEHHREFNRLHAEPLARNIAPHSNDPSPGRRLRVGYLAVDLNSHSVACCMKPLLQNHDKSAFEIFSYVHGREDETTSHLQRYSDHWRSVEHLTDEKLAALIRADEIDILIDLQQHTDRNRLRVFAPPRARASFLSRQPGHDRLVDDGLPSDGSAPRTGGRFSRAVHGNGDSVARHRVLLFSGDAGP